MLFRSQANTRIIEAVRERLGLTPKQVFINLDRVGNTSAASIPIAMAQAVREHRLAQGDLLLCVAFGAGLTWASSLIRW